MQNKPQTGHKLDNLFMSFKNSPLTNPINLNNSLDTRMSYSHSIQHRNLHKTNNLSNNYIPVVGSPRREFVRDLDTRTLIQSKSNNSIYNPSAKCVKEYSYKEERNSQYRNTMEDFSKIIEKYMGDNSQGLFTLYDGHGGTEPVKYVKERMPDVLAKFLKENNNIEKALIFSFQKMDDELKLLSECENVGTTACVVYIYRENDIIVGSKRVVYCANVGDTRCVLVTANEAKRLSYDHKCIDEAEVARIRKVGGVVFNGRIFGQLALSRALGDHSMKKYGVIATPCVNRHVISDKDRYIVMGSDGVWDALDDDEVFRLSLTCNNADDFCNIIVKTALEKGSRDNISAITIKIN
jgi:serine/threonine protein phosphatase PrpC